ncbi:hypothetical protein L3X38_016579 [Prunus dulcis]|uniref:Uncharacterized protein n=1 Tax=Prunus dulcis TaxID=3755 RepID=A0AAD4W5N0_PRUDU|nr:hypothetical protein L3X38_016579 [Prunus dulcis]
MIINRNFIHPHLSPTVDFANQNDIDLLLLQRISGSCSLTYYQNKVIHKVKDEIHSVHHDNQAFDVYSKIEFPIAAKKNFGNSHLRVLVTLPMPGITFRSHGKNNASLGFGFDAMTNDYKVVQLVTLLEDDEQPTLAEVYSLATGTWSNLGYVSPASISNNQNRSKRRRSFNRTIKVHLEKWGLGRKPSDWSSLATRSPRISS